MTDKIFGQIHRHFRHTKSCSTIFPRRYVKRHKNSNFHTWLYLSHPCHMATTWSQWWSAVHCICLRQDHSSSFGHTRHLQNANLLTRVATLQTEQILRLFQENIWHKKKSRNKWNFYTPIVLITASPSHGAKLITLTKFTGISPTRLNPWLFPVILFQLSAFFPDSRELPDLSRFFQRFFQKRVETPIYETWSPPKSLKFRSCLCDTII